MGRLRLLAVAFIVAGLACAASAPAFANILIQIDKPSQTMTVSVDGQLLYRWPVSTGATGFSRSRKHARAFVDLYLTSYA